MPNFKSYLMIGAISLVFGAFLARLALVLGEVHQVLLALVKMPFQLSAIIISVVVFAWLLVSVLEVQMRRESQSYFYYLYTSFAFSLPSSYIFLFFQDSDLVQSSINNIVVWTVITVSLYLLKFVVVDNEKRFLAAERSPEIIDEEDDKYEFSKTAGSIVEMINSLKEPVSVLKLRGDLGAGKTTMISFIENRLNDESTLITYISLTETNEETDLSKLFTERWFETLSSRYLMISQKINQVGLSSLKSILRDSGNGLIGSIVSVLEVFDFPLRPTKKNGTKDQFISTENAKLFNYIPEIKEDLWLIVIDEIERAPFKEILRLIEIVERFKIRAEGGFPIKICFLIVTADTELRARLLGSYEKHDGDIIDAFLFKDLKSITHHLWLPPKNYEASSKHFLDKATQLAREFDLDIGLSNDDMKDISMYYSYFSSRDDIDTIKFEPSHKAAMSFINHVMLNETPRVINRTIEQCRIFLSAYKNSYKKDFGYNLRSRSIYPRYADLLILSYAAIKCSWLIDFFNKTIIDLQPNSNIDYSYLKWSDVKREKDSDKLKKVIKEIVSHQIQDSELKFLSGVFKFATNCYTGLIGHADDKNINVELFNSTSYAPNLNEFLSSVVGGLSTNTEIKSFEILKSHKLEGLNLHINNIDLLNYSRLLNKLNLDKRMELLVLEVAEEIAKRIREDNFNYKDGDEAFTISESDTAVYQFVFLLTNLLAYKGQIVEEIKNKCLDLLVSILGDSNVQTNVKYLILSSFVNSQRSTGRIHAEMQNAFEVLKNHDTPRINKIIKSVYAEFRQRYIELGQDIFKEEKNNPYYVMYQSWSGDTKDIAGIKELRDIAKRHLKNNLDVLQKMWERYPSEEEYENHDFRIRGISDNVYLTLDDLIEVTEISELATDTVISKKMEFWRIQRALKKTEIDLKEPKEPHDKTLVMSLIDQGYLAG